jgi:hypothetical protein
VEENGQLRIRITLIFGKVSVVEMCLGGLQSRSSKGQDENYLYVRMQTAEVAHFWCAEL